jgi:hypothetical protein
MKGFSRGPITMFKYQGVAPCNVPIENQVTETYDDFYLSYSADTRDYGCETTALVFGQMALFFILKGDHRKNYEKALEQGGKDAALDYFIDNIDQAHQHGNHKSIFNENDPFHAMDHARKHLSQEVRDRIAIAVGVTKPENENGPEL